MLAGIIYIIGGIIEALVGFRFLFRLFGANPDSGIVNFVYSLSAPLVTPFSGIFGQNAVVVNSGVVTTSVFEWTTLIAFVVYGLLFTFISTAAGRAGSRS